MNNINLDILALLCPDQAAERDAAFTEAIINDNWDPCREYCEKHRLTVPEDEKVFKVGTCKAAYNSLTLPIAVKVAAADLAFELGGTPYFIFGRR